MRSAPKSARSAMDCGATEGWEGTGAGTREWVFRFGSGVSTRRGHSDRGGGSERPRGGIAALVETAWREERIAPPRRAAATPPGTSRRRRARGSTGFGARRHRDERAKPPARPHVLHPASPTRRRPRDAWSRSRTRPPHQRSSSATPRGPRGALSRAPRYATSCAPIRGLNRAHPSLQRSLLRPSVARRISHKCDLRWTTRGRERTCDASPLDRSARSFVLYTR